MSASAFGKEIPLRPRAWTAKIHTFSAPKIVKNDWHKSYDYLSKLWDWPRSFWRMPWSIGEV